MAGRTITRADLSEAVYQKLGLSRTESAALVERVLDEICDGLARGETVKLSSFGSFLVRDKGQRIGRNPKTGVEVPIEPRRVMVFKPSNVLKARINSVEPSDIPQHVLRFWETRFSTIRPLKRGGGRRYYRPDDIDLLRGIRQLLYGQGYTIRGVQRILKDDGLRVVQAIGRGEPVPVGREPEREDADGGDDAAASDADDAAGEVPRPVAALSAEPADGDEASLSAADRERLQAVLDELLECGRILGTLKVQDQP